MVIPWINMGPAPDWIKLDRVVDKYGTPGGACWYIGELCLQGRTGFTDEVSVFWQEKPAKPEFSNYFGIYRQHGGVMITNAISVTDGFWDGRMDTTGEIVFSRFRHDYRASKTGRVVVDGGRDYYKGHGGIPVQLKVIDGRMRIIKIHEPEL